MLGYAAYECVFEYVDARTNNFQTPHVKKQRLSNRTIQNWGCIWIVHSITLALLPMGWFQREIHTYMYVYIYIYAYRKNHIYFYTIYFVVYLYLIYVYMYIYIYIYIIYYYIAEAGRGPMASVGALAWA